MTDAVQVQDTTIEAVDGYRLAATSFTPAGEPRGVALINSATAVPRRIYRGFAAYLTERGLAALTYDYRGIGGSRPASLRGFSARMRDWASLDATAALAHARRAYPRVPLVAVGHSFGGHAIGLVPNNSEIARALLVASQAGYWRLFASPERYRVYLIMRCIGTPIAKILGYVPGRLGLGVDMPGGVFLEWADWVTRRRYFFDDPTLAELANFPRYRGPLTAIGLADDPWATPEAIAVLLAGFTGTQPEFRLVHPADIGVAKIGHFGFFRPNHRETLWRPAADWLAAACA
jgi:predicted alpha/beta hydrolase